MAVPAEDALLQTPGSVWTVLQHLHVVVGFEHKIIGRADAVEDKLGHVSEVGGETKIPRVRMDDEADGVLRVVRNGERVHDQIANLETRAGDEQPKLDALDFERALDFIFCSAIAIDW